MREKECIERVEWSCENIPLDGDPHDYEEGFLSALRFVLGDDLPDRIKEIIYDNDEDEILRDLNGKYLWEQ